MINTQDQEELLKLISNYLEKDITCIAIGGTAMMLKGYKNATKDIDLVFESEEDRNMFIKAIKKLGYKEMSIKGIYRNKKETGEPLMYTRGDERFDLFVKDVFGIKPDEEKLDQRHDFIRKKELIVKILSKEQLILFKAVTGRERDLEDIKTIVDKENEINWNEIVDEGIKQKENNPWILYDLEETLQEIRKTRFIKQKLIDQIYEAEEKK